MQSTNDVADLTIAVVIVALVVRQQLRTRLVRRNGSLITPVVLGLLGVFGIAFGVARARTVRVWSGPQGEVLRKGTATTTALWLTSVAVHLGLSLWIDHAAGVGLLGTASLYAYLAIGLGTQNLLVRGRATALGPQPDTADTKSPEARRSRSAC